MENEELNLELIFIPKNEVRDTNKNLINKIKLSVIYFTGYANNISGVNIDLIPESGQEVGAGGYKFNNGKLTKLINNEPIEENPDTSIGQLAIECNNYFKKNPDKYEKLIKTIKKQVSDIK